MCNPNSSPRLSAPRGLNQVSSSAVLIFCVREELVYSPSVKNHAERNIRRTHKTKRGMDTLTSTPGRKKTVVFSVKDCCCCPSCPNLMRLVLSVLIFFRCFLLISGERSRASFLISLQQIHWVMLFPSVTGENRFSPRQHI